MSNTTDIALIPDAFTARQIEIIKSQIAKGATDDELAYFIEVCKLTGLNPMVRQIYAIKRGGQMTIQTGIDGYRLVAGRTKELAGIDDPVYDTETEEHPNKATVTVYRLIAGNRVPFTASARWKEYNAGAGLWPKMPYHMLAKCAEALALRKAFPAELSGVYTGEEMQQADADYPLPTTPYVESAPTPTKEPTPIQRDPAPTGRALPGQIRELKALCDALGEPLPTTATAADAAKAIIERKRRLAAKRHPIEGAEFTFTADEPADAEIPTDVLKTMPLGKIGA